MTLLQQMTGRVSSYRWCGGFLVLVASLGCQQASSETDVAAAESSDSASMNEPPPEAMSLLGRPLHRNPPSDAVREEFEQKLIAAEAESNDNPASAEALIWFGRRTAYLGHYQAAIEIFSQGIQRFPRDARFLRHRGHRLLSTRQLERATQDFTAAYAMVEGVEDQVEPDGMPNAQGIPTSTLHSNIRYHLGLAHYLQGDFEAALPLYEEDVARAANADMRIASTYWRYLTLRRLGREDDANAVLKTVDAGLGLIENFDYHRLLLYFAGQLDQAELLGGGASAEALPGLKSATLSYGVATYDLVEGRKDLARQRYESIVSGAQWSAFGYLAAEAELALWSR